MGFFSSLAKVGKNIFTKGPIKSLIKATPIGAMAYAGANIAGSAFGGSKSKGATPMASSFAGMPPLPSGVTSTLGSPPSGPGIPPSSSMGKRSIFRDDPNVIAAIKPYAIDNRFLKQYYRAPKGFIIAYDLNGDAFAVPRYIAKMYLGWKPAKKPPISVSDWQAMMKAKRVLKKLQSIEQMSRKMRLPAKRSSGSGRSKAIPANYQVIESGPGSLQLRSK